MIIANQMSANQRFVLFYSPKLRAFESQEIIHAIQRAGCRAYIVLVNVDNVPANAIPEAIKTIPCMWDRDQRCVVDCNDVIQQYMALLRQQQEMTSASPLKEPSALVGGGLTDQFSFLSEDHVDDAHVSREYVYIHDAESTGRIYTPEEDQVSGSRSSSAVPDNAQGRGANGGMNDIDALMQQREQAIQSLRQQQM